MDIIDKWLEAVNSNLFDRDSIFNTNNVRSYNKRKMEHQKKRKMKMVKASRKKNRRK